MTCDKCPKYNECRKPCQDIEDILKAEGIKSANWIRPRRAGHKRGDGRGKAREIPFSALSSQDKEIFRRKYGDFEDL